MSRSRATEPQASTPSSAAPAATSGSGAKRSRAFALRAALGIAIVAILLWHYDARPVLRTLAREHLVYFAIAVALYLAGQVMSAYRWRLLAAMVNLRGPFAEFLTYYFIGMFTNLFVPGLVGGDAARAVYLGRRHQRIGDAFASVVADRGIGLVAIFWLAAFAAIFLNGSALPPAVTRPAIAVGAIALLGFLTAPIFARLLYLAPAIIRRSAGLAAPYLHRPAATIPALILSLVLQVSLAVAQWILARGLGLDAPLALFILCVPIANLFTALPITLNGLGIRETAYVALFGMAGMGKNDAIAIGLLWFAATMLGGLTGLYPFVTTSLPPIISTEA
ncbi:MAG TPA: lysylphosphatidylglycerol synthase transmembrane domain-containing protein [Candidatus Binataceae bacterium]